MRLIVNEKIAQWGDPFTPPQTRTRCIKYASGNWPWGGGWKTCTEWATDVKTMEVKVFLEVKSPDNIEDAIANIVRNCALVAGQAGITAIIGTPSPEISVRLAAALAVIESTFIKCVTQHSLEASFSLNLTHTTEWGRWSGGPA